MRVRNRPDWFAARARVRRSVPRRKAFACKVGRDRFGRTSLCSYDLLKHPRPSMASLAPPPTPHRNRASSTSIRPPLTLSSLGRRRSNSDLPPPCHTPPLVSTPTMQKEVAALSIDIPSPTHKVLARATFAELYTRFMELLHVSQKESPYPSTPSSPRLSRSSTSTEDSILPITSPTVASFHEAYSEKPPTKTASWLKGAPSVRL